uniref:VPS9 domain-containing protein n=1 Tax=Ananas comosus var. bracteatus TaxID=296719 RepID=A0A6V7NHU5_ANACO|nr:unnamed protein product [Ananas comosus var. bracteatus]
MDASAAATPLHLDFYGFLNRLRRPGAADLVGAVKSFLVSFSLYAPDAESDSRRVQDFLLTMERTIKQHPLWANTPDEEIDSAIEGLEKYVMTKLFDRTFGSSTEDAKLDVEISEKIRLLQHFVKPDHLDVPIDLQNEASWLFAVKELQKINAFKAPREKLLCIMNCCQVINNLLLNVSMTTNSAPAGADEFLPILIYVTIKANPPQLHSNLKYVQLFRRREKLVSEMEYYLTNLFSAEMFITNINGSSLSMKESEFQKSMQAARFANEVGDPYSVPELAKVDPPIMTRHGKEIHLGGSNKYPFMERDAEDLTREDVKMLLGLYKQLVTKYTRLSEALRRHSLDEDLLIHTARDLTRRVPSKSIVKDKGAFHSFIASGRALKCF